MHLKLPKFKLSICHPQHAILGLVIIAVSTVLLCNDYYFFYPPFMSGFLNDDGIGVLGWILGLNLIIWAKHDHNSVRVNFWLLIFSCAFWSFEATAELIHGCIAGKPHMITVCILEVGMLLFTLSIIGKSQKIER